MVLSCHYSKCVCLKTQPLDTQRWVPPKCVWNPSFCGGHSPLGARSCDRDALNCTPKLGASDRLKREAMNCRILFLTTQRKTVD